MTEVQRLRALIDKAPHAFHCANQICAHIHPVGTQHIIDPDNPKARIEVDVDAHPCTETIFGHVYITDHLHKPSGPCNCWKAQAAQP